MMRETKPAAEPPPRQPRVFKIDDPSIAAEPEDIFADAGAATSRRNEPAAQSRSLTAGDLNRGIRWGSILLSAAASLASLAAGLWFTRFVSVALSRQDWVGWVAFGLMSIIALALTVLVVRELIGFRRLARLSKLRKSVRDSIASGDTSKERAAVATLTQHYRGRPDMAWGLARLADHKGDVLEPGE